MLQEICTLNFVSYFRTKKHTYRSASKIDYRIVIFIIYQHALLTKLKNHKTYIKIYTIIPLFMLLSVIYGLLYKFYKREDKIKGI